jgi:hypothetical protein
VITHHLTATGNGNQYYGSRVCSISNNDKLVGRGNSRGHADRHAIRRQPTTNQPPAPVAVPVLSLRPADSPRLNGEDKARIARLAETETALPPILLDRPAWRPRRWRPSGKLQVPVDSRGT